MPSSSSSAAAGPCEPFDIHVRGRQGIGVSQPQAGIDYPLVRPTEDVRYLIADSYLSFDQPSDYDEDEPDFELPFRIHWMYGFGCVPPEYPIPGYDSSLSSYSSVCSSEALSLSSNSSASAQQINCLPIPKHAHDIIIVDNKGRVVFDSTEADITHETRPWGDRLRVVTWQHPNNSCMSLVYHTAWNPNDFPEPRNYPVYFFPQSATLDERAIERLPKRLRSLTVILDNLRKTPVDFVAGYNMLLETGETFEAPGERRRTRVSFNATPGAGLGVFPGCEPEQLVIRRINGVGPTNEGDFYLSATDCYWVRQPTTVITEVPRTTLPSIELPPGNIPVAGLPDPAAGTAKNLPGWPLNDNPAYAHLQVGNDCEPCCDCPDYVATAQYLNRTRNDYHDLGVKFEDTRDTYHENRERWLIAACCFERRPLRIRLLPQICPFLDVAIQFCNQTQECKTNLELVASFTTSPAGGRAVEVPGYTFITGASPRPGRTSARTERYQMGGEWPTFTAFFDVVQPGQSVSARFRLKFADCGFASLSSSMSMGTIDDTPIAVTGCLTGTVDGEPITIPVCDSLPETEEAEVCETQTLNCPPGNESTTNLLICACEK